MRNSKPSHYFHIEKQFLIFYFNPVLFCNIQQILLASRNISQMNQQFYNKRFQRNQYLLSPPSHDVTPKSSSLSRQVVNPNPKVPQNRDQSKDNPIPITEQNIFDRLIIIQNAIEIERRQRLQENTKMLKLIKEMQCKHNAIIYDSEIKYCKSPPKIGIDNGGKVKQNMRSKQKSVKTATSSTQRTSKTQNIEETNSNIIINDENPQKQHFNTLLNTKFQIQATLIARNVQEIISTKLHNFRQENTKQIQQNLKNLSEQILNKKKETKTSQDSEDLQMKNLLSKQINELKLNLQKKIASIQKQMQDGLQTSQTNLHKSLVQFTNKIKQIQNNVNTLVSPLENKVQKLFEEVKSQGEYINRFDSMNQQFSNRIKEISQHFTQKVNELQIKFKEQQQIFNKKSKLIEDERKRQFQMTQKIADIAQKAQLMKIVYSKEIQSRSQKIQQHLIKIIEKHIAYIQNFIQTIAEKQNIIMSRFCQKIQNSTQNSPSIEESASNKDQFKSELIQDVK